MPHVRTSDGLRIHYALHGAPDRPAVVLLMGLGAPGTFWFDIPERLAADDEHPYRVVVVDNRGTGRSDMPTRPFGMPRFADDVAQVLDDAGIDRAFVVGMSMGGMIAQHVALRHPERVRGLGLFCTSAGLISARFATPFMLGTLLSAPFTKKGEGEKVLGRLLLAPSRQHEAAALVHQYRDAMRDSRPSPEAFARHLGAILTHHTLLRLDRIRVPTAVVTGDSDALLHPSHSRVLADRIPNARLEVLPEVGHGLHSSDPDAVRRTLSWLRSQTDRGRA